jgi:hypothetical protein
LNKLSKTQQIEQRILQVIKEKKPENVKELLTFLQGELQISENELLKVIMKLQNDGKITFQKQLSTPQNFLAYLKTEKTYWYWLTITIAIITAAIVFTIPEDFHPWVYVRNVLGAIFVLWLPGYTFIKALFPAEVPIKTSKESLDTIERIALSLGMSLALVPIVGLLLNYTPWGIRLIPIVLSLFAVVIIFSTAALAREYQLAKQKLKPQQEP